MPELTVVTPTRGRPEVLARMLGSLRGEGFEVVVVSDSEDPDAAAAADAVRSCGLDAQHLRAKQPGAAAARNAGVAAARAAVVLFLDDDVLGEPELLARHAAFHREHPAPERALLGGVEWAGELRVTPFMRWLEHGVQFDFLGIDGPEAGWGRFYTINSSVKKALFDRAGGFDAERFPFHYEDLELARRMADHGLRLGHDPQAKVEHLHAVTPEEYEGRMRAVGAAARRFAELHPDAGADLHDRFERALTFPPASGRGAKLLGLLPRSTPVLGERMWTSADRHYCQRLGPAFLEGWSSPAA